VFWEWRKLRGWCWSFLGEMGKFGGGGCGGREHVSEVRVVTEFKYSVITSIRESLISFEHE
jgi:hypothetical protein